MSFERLIRSSLFAVVLLGGCAQRSEPPVPTAAEAAKAPTETAAASNVSSGNAIRRRRRHKRALTRECDEASHESCLFLSERRLYTFVGAATDCTLLDTHERLLMETEWYNRAEAIQQRITQLRDSL